MTCSLDEGVLSHLMLEIIRELNHCYRSKRLRLAAVRHRNMFPHAMLPISLSCSLRKLAGERKAQFDVGSYTEKRSLAAEIVQTIRELDPPGRFLQKRPSIKDDDAASSSGWEEVSDETAIRKANQAMRDINRPDREHRLQRKRQRLLAKEDKQKAKKEAREKLLIEKVPNSHILFHHESSDDIFRNQMVAEALDSALGSLGSVPIPHMESS